MVLLYLKLPSGSPSVLDGNLTSLQSPRRPEVIWWLTAHLTSCSTSSPVIHHVPVILTIFVSPKCAFRASMCPPLPELSSLHQDVT